MAYLDEHPNRTLNQQRARRDKPSGLIVVHTAESALDATGEDTGAEGVARFISQRSSYGSYHRLADSDSVVAVARFEMTTYGDGTGSNDFAIHISFACRAADWPRMSAERKAAFIRNGAKAAHEAAVWLKREHGITVPAKRVSRAESDRRVPGFISHGERDPGRRTDPGPEFPWQAFLGEFERLQNPGPTPAERRAAARKAKGRDLANDLTPVIRSARSGRHRFPAIAKALGKARASLRGRRETKEGA